MGGYQPAHVGAGEAEALGPREAHRAGPDEDPLPRLRSRAGVPKEVDLGDFMAGTDPEKFKAQVRQFLLEHEFHFAILRQRTNQPLAMRSYPPSSALPSGGGTHCRPSSGGTVSYRPVPSRTQADSRPRPSPSGWSCLREQAQERRDGFRRLRPSAPLLISGGKRPARQQWIGISS